jgi:O-antigen ligase
MFFLKNLKNSNLNNLLFLLLCFIPAALISGPFLPDFIVFVFIFVFIFFSKIKLNLFLKDNYFKLFFYFWISICISSIMSANLLFSLNTSFFFLRFFLFSFFCGFIIFYNKKKLHLFFKILLFTLTFFSIDSLFQYFFGYNILSYKQIVENRLGGLFNNKLVVGSYLSKLYPILLAVYFFCYDKITKNWKHLFLFSSIIITIVIFLSGERASFYHHVIFLTLFLFISNIKNLFGNKIYLYLLLVVSLILMFIVFNPKIKNRIFSPIFKINIEKNIFTNYHLAHFYSAYKIFLDNKLIGAGPRMFRKLCSEERYDVHDVDNLKNYNPCSTHPHNTYIQILAEGGLIAFFIIIIFYLLVASKIIKQIYYKLFKNQYFYKNYEVCIQIAIFVYFFPLSTNGNFFNNWVNIFLSLYLSFNYFFFIFKRNK